nr:MAG TPA: hypothetical protein [Bacteriophage sp.]DAT80889.1 MAG TPA: hypothetical protein [Caudoviricetes sp.]
MLIRSQDKRMIVNFDNICTVSAFPEKDSEDIYVEDGTGSLMVGRYSTKAKAMKVLDMIQEAYANAELIPMAVPNIGKMFTEASPSKENELLAEAFGEALMNKMVFQMPVDSEVEV